MIYLQIYYPQHSQNLNFFNSKLNSKLNFSIQNDQNIVNLIDRQYKHSIIKYTITFAHK